MIPQFEKVKLLGSKEKSIDDYDAYRKAEKEIENQFKQYIEVRSTV